MRSRTAGVAMVTESADSAIWLQMQAAHECLEKGELQRAAAEFQRAAEELEGSSSDKISCLLNAGACLVSLADYTGGLACLDSARSIITGSPTGLGEGAGRDLLSDVHYNSAIAHQALGDHEKAVEEFQHCIDLQEQSGQLNTAADTIVALAGCHREAGQARCEISCLEKARSVSRRAGDSGREGVVCVALARGHLREGREGECRQMLSTAEMVSSRVDDKAMLGLLYSRCGLVHTSLDQHDEALRCFQQALPLVRGSGGTSDDQLLQEASLLQNIGAAYNEKQMYSESLVYHREAATMHGQLGNHHEAEVKSLCNLAFAQSQLQDYTSASLSLSGALERAHTTETDTSLLAQAHESLGSCYYCTGHLQEAEAAFNSALELLNRSGEDGGSARERLMKKLSEVRQTLHDNSSPTPTGDQKTHTHASSRTPPLSESMEQETASMQQEMAQTNSVSLHEGRVKKKSTTAESDTHQNQDSFDEDIQAYEEALNGSKDSSEFTDGPGVGRTNSIESSLSPGQDDINGQPTIAEGSLAIGANAREMYTVQQGNGEAGVGRRKRTTRATEIVRRDGEGERTACDEDSIDGGASHTPPTTHNTAGSAQHSKTCSIL